MSQKMVDQELFDCFSVRLKGKVQRELYHMNDQLWQMCVASLGGDALKRHTLLMRFFRNVRCVELAIGVHVCMWTRRNDNIRIVAGGVLQFLPMEKDVSLCVCMVSYACALVQIIDFPYRTNGHTVISETYSTSTFGKRVSVSV